MSYEKLLCVGGEYNGRRIPIHEDVKDLMVPIENVGGTEFTQIAYKRMYIHGEDKTFCVLLLDGLTANDLFEKLIENYKGE